MRYYQFVFILFLFLGCKEKNISVDKTIENKAVKSEQLKSIEEDILIDTMVFKNISIIPLETNNESLFREISRISINNERIFILDESLNNIYIFNRNGKYINKIQHIGSGPVEYISIIDFCLDDETKDLFILCDRPYKLMRFSQNGHFISQVSFSTLYNEISIFDDHLFCLLNQSSDQYEIGCFDKNLNLVYKGILSNNSINNDCQGKGKHLVKSKKLTYSRNFDPSLYYLSNEFIEKAYEFDFGKYTIPTNIKDEKNCLKLFEACQDQKYIYSITNIVESDVYIIFSTNLGICLFNKETKILNGYELIYNQSLNFGSNIYFPNEGSGNSIIGSFAPSSFSQYTEKTIKNNPILSDLVTKVSSDDNPILILYEFKE